MNPNHFLVNLTYHSENGHYAIPADQLQFHEMGGYNNRASGPENWYQAEYTLNGVPIIINLCTYNHNYTIEIEPEMAGYTWTHNFAISESE